MLEINPCGTDGCHALHADRLLSAAELAQGFLQHVSAHFVHPAAEKVSLWRFSSEFLAVKSEQFYRLRQKFESDCVSSF